MNDGPALEIITPSYQPDLPLCQDLVASLAGSYRPGVTHRVIVPRRDVTAFTAALPPAVVVDGADEYLPVRLQAVPRNVWIDRRRPWPPMRGWIVQQLIKLEAARRSAADVVLMADSDLVFVRPVSATTFCSALGVSLYRRAAHIDQRLPRHVRWHAAARRLLGVDAELVLPLPDYICWPCGWDPRIVGAALDQIEQVTGRPWWSAIGSELHFSEMILYGVFAELVLPAAQRPPVVATMRAVEHSAEQPLDAAGLGALLARLEPDDVAVMVSAKSATDLDLRRSLLLSPTMPS